MFAERNDASCVKKDWTISHTGAVRGLTQRHAIILNGKFFPAANVSLSFVFFGFFLRGLFLLFLNLHSMLCKSFFFYFFLFFFVFFLALLLLLLLLLFRLFLFFYVSFLFLFVFLLYFYPVGVFSLEKFILLFNFYFFFFQLCLEFVNFLLDNSLFLHLPLHHRLLLFFVMILIRNIFA